MLDQAKDNKFQKKKFNNCGKLFGYTSYLNFTTAVESTTANDDDIKFKCLFCDLSLTALFRKDFKY